ncbi:MAG TPA: hypothetical protein VHB46_04955 [Burkholderiales bacterium]|nr:hypothetical protein [Burkholderiales bacterium]
MTSQPSTPDPVCRTCGVPFVVPPERLADAATFIEEESARCARMQEIQGQRQSLAERMQSGIAGLMGSEPLDTVDMLSQRRSLAHLDETLKSEADTLRWTMRHTPKYPVAREN